MKTTKLLMKLPDSHHPNDPYYFCVVTESALETKWHAEVRYGVYPNEGKVKFFDDRSTFDQEVQAKLQDGYIEIQDAHHDRNFYRNWLIQVGLLDPLQ